MQPQQPPTLSPTPLPTDYLDQIASPQKASGISSRLFFIIIGAALVLVIGFIILLFSGANTPKSASTERLALRLQTLQKVSQSAHKNIKSSTLRSINSNLTVSLINSNRDIATPLKAAKIDLKKTDKKLTAEENGDTLNATLEKARLNVDFDNTYAREMSYELERTIVLMNGLLKTTRSISLKTFLQSSTKDLSTLQKQFSTYNSADS